ncbi:double-strand-break repair protein rad21-like protein 1 [Mauremys reevesii]|uniref:double-strand-break repair protein rad21-like protein 1 n=1 Tax=Mauremys reevesii TaxID=260615 RepID=UPI00193F6367|nr:double-strand-break repair protein rad21-like protein 1 [Mauremys reevesii]XP_039353216.1 double-strand-break repair protein rad21-like protein 1 [Mauremys reevesii]
MFYMHLFMNKRGPLAKIWLAAHWEKKLTKTHIFECNLETTIEKIISPKVKIALRTSGHLLLGVVRIYHRKAKYLLADCSEALVKMKMAFRPGLVDLPEESFEAAYNSITLPEEFPEFDTQLPDLNAIDVAEHFTLNQSRPEDITLPEDYRMTMLPGDGNFGEETEILRGHSFFSDGILMSTNSLLPDHSSVSTTGDKSILCDDTHGFKLDGFGDEDVPGDMIENLLRTEQNSLIYDILDMEEEAPLSQELPDDNGVVNFSYVGSVHPEESHQMSETMLLTNEKEGFTLEPVDATVVIGRRIFKRKRKLLVDVVKELSSSTIYKQLSNCTDILTMLDLAPPTRKLMMWKKSGGVDKLLSRTTQPLINAELQMLFANCFKYHGFKTGRKSIQTESETEETRQERETTEMLIIEESSYLQESAYTETERTISDDSFVLALQNGRNEDANKMDEAIEMVRNDQDSEERRWSKRTLQILNILRYINKSGVSSISFLELCKNNDRKQVSAKFYSFLVLKKQLAIELTQCAPYADIIVTVGPKFHTI